MSIFDVNPLQKAILTNIQSSEEGYTLTLQELQLIYKQLEREYIKDNQMKELLNKIQKLIQMPKDPCYLCGHSEKDHDVNTGQSLSMESDPPSCHIKGCKCGMSYNAKLG